MSLQIRDDRQMRALTGVSLSQFDILLDMFSQTYHQMQWQAYEEGLLYSKLNVTHSFW